jgi:NADPH:quinone reductase-like Zn-dependent oxidoreductase
VTVLDGPVTLRVAYDPDRRRATVHDTDGDELLASLRVYAARSEGAVVPLPEVPAGATEAAEAAQRLFGRRGMHYGEAFRGLSAWWGTPDDVHAELQLPEGLDGTAHDLHPAMLDAALQALLVPVLRDTPGVRVLPVGIDRLQLLGEVPPTVRLVGRVDGDGERERTARLSLVHPQTGEVVVRLTGLRCRLLPTATDAASAGHFLTEWTEVALRDAGAEPAVIGADDTDDPVAAAAALQVALVWAIDAGQPAVVLTRGAWALDDDDVCPRPVAAVRAGIVRTAANEGHPVRLVDLPRDRDEDQAFIEAALASDQPELALRGGRALARQVVLAEPPQPVAPSQRPASEVDGWELVLDDGRWALHEVARRAPDAGELQVALDYASLNFKDLLKAANRLDARALQGTFFGASLGMEACGRVVAVGADVERYRVGDPVVLVHPGALASHLTLRQEWVAPAVPHLGAAQAAAPIAMLTATMALDDLARLQPGERVLIHQATGGVGRCALAIAQRRGARIFATAGTEAKRALLREEGVAVGDSRSHDFVADVLAWSDGEGVDVALCALDRTGLDRTVDAMARFGRLIDIGKDAQVSDHALGLRPFHKALSYIAFDLDQVFEHQPERAHRAVERVQEALRTEALPPPPVTVFDLDHVAEAFDRFRAPDHTGKIVLDLSAGDRPVRCAQARHPALRADGTYLVTGGLDGFGAELVRWLARHGAGAVVAASRRGPDAPQAGPLAEQVEQHGARFVALALDVADRDAGPAPSTPCAAPTCRRCGACSTGRWCSTTAPWSTTTPRPTPACSVPSCSGRCTSTR